jgi:hypothetical protein
MSDPMEARQGAGSAKGADATREAAPGSSDQQQQTKARSMRLNELKTRVQGDAYVINPYLVAEALLRRPAPRRVLVPAVSRDRVRDRGASAVQPRPTA